MWHSFRLLSFQVISQTARFHGFRSKCVSHLGAMKADIKKQKFESKS